MVPSFTVEAQELFAQLSGDYNPIHMDPLVARRLMYGRPVVHGIHVLLRALDRWLEGGANRLRLTKVSAKFRSPSLLDQVADFAAIPTHPDKAELPGSVKLIVMANGARLLTATVAYERQVTPDRALAAERPKRVACRDRSATELLALSGRIPLSLDRSIASRLFPHVVQRLPAEQIAVLLATSRLVGMEAPGLHSIFTGLELQASTALVEPALVYQVEAYDERVSLASLHVDAPGLSGSLAAVLRPAPTAQASCGEVRTLVTPDEFRDERALVIGGSRGLGEVAAKELAAGGAHVKLTYHRGALDAEKVTEEIVTHGGVAQCFAYDARTDAGELLLRVGEWSPTILCYFPTPFISAAVKGQFSRERFAEFCDYYVQGFHDTFHSVRRLGDDLRYVLCPSSCLIDELPSTFGEYIAAKSAAETVCRLLEKTYRDVRIYAPRLPRMATDQTASVLSNGTQDPAEVMLAALRELRRPTTANRADSTHRGIDPEE